MYATFRQFKPMEINKRFYDAWLVITSRILREVVTSQATRKERPLIWGLLIGEAKRGRDKLSRRLMPDLVRRSQRMPQVAEGWSTQYCKSMCCLQRRIYECFATGSAGNGGYVGFFRGIGRDAPTCLSKQALFLDIPVPLEREPCEMGR
jgi:hypothetical protein